MDPFGRRKLTATISVCGFNCKTQFLNLIYHGAGTVVHLLLLKFSMAMLVATCDLRDYLLVRDPYFALIYGPFRRSA